MLLTSSKDYMPVEAYTYITANFVNPKTGRVISLSQMVSETSDSDGMPGGDTPDYQVLEDSLFNYAKSLGLTPADNTVMAKGSHVSANPESESHDVSCIVKAYHENSDGTVIAKLLFYKSWNLAKTYGMYPVTTVYFNSHDKDAKVEKLNEWLSQLPDCNLTFETMPTLGTPEEVSVPNPRKPDVKRPCEIYFSSYIKAVPEWQATLPIKTKVVKSISTKAGNNFGKEVTNYPFVDFIVLY